MDKTDRIRNDARLITDEIMGRVKRAKSAQCEQTPMTDAPPMLFIAFGIDESDPNYEAASTYCSELGLSHTVNIGFTPLFHEGDPTDSLRSAIKQLAGTMKVDFLYFVAEGYMKPMDKDEFQSHERGSLEKDFSENPFSEVREGIVVTGVDWDLTAVWSSTVTYRYDDFGVPTYDETQHDEMLIDDKFISDETGRIPAFLAGGMALIVTAWQMRGFAEQVVQDDKKRNREGGE